MSTSNSTNRVNKNRYGYNMVFNNISQKVRIFIELRCRFDRTFYSWIASIISISVAHEYTWSDGIASSCQLDMAHTMLDANTVSGDTTLDCVDI